MYLVPAWMLGSMIRISPTFISLPIAGMTCITRWRPPGSSPSGLTATPGTPGRLSMSGSKLYFFPYFSNSATICSNRFNSAVSVGP